MKFCTGSQLPIMALRPTQEQVRALGEELDRFAVRLAPEQQSLLRTVLLLAASAAESESTAGVYEQLSLGQIIARLAGLAAHRDESQAAQKAAGIDGC